MQEFGWQVAAGLFKRGVLVAGTYSKAQVIRIEPALGIPMELLQEMLNRLEDTFKEVARGLDWAVARADEERGYVEYHARRSTPRGSPAPSGSTSPPIHRSVTMLLIREVFHCRPGKVRALIEKFQAMNRIMAKAGQANMRLMTDFTGERYWTLVAEFETPEHGRVRENDAGCRG